jgi:hypothetical protein
VSVECKFASAAEARKANYFSRRHRTAEEHQTARQTYKDRKTEQLQQTLARVTEQVTRAEKRRKTDAKIGWGG